jgi:hypothetical protein
MDYRRQAVISYLIACTDDELAALLTEARGGETRDNMAKLWRTVPPISQSD